MGRLRKVFSSVGVVFKGSGFYRNDSRARRSQPGGGKLRRRSQGQEPRPAGRVTGRPSSTAGRPTGRAAAIRLQGRLGQTRLRQQGVERRQPVVDSGSRSGRTSSSSGGKSAG